MSPRIPTVALLLLLGGCIAATAPVDASRPIAGASSRDAVLDPGCTFDTGTTTCVSTTETTVTSTHVAVSGCNYGPTGIPSRRSRTFEDTFLVTATTTTLQHGRQGAVYDSSTETTRTLVSSVQISDVCEAP